MRQAAAAALIALRGRRVLVVEDDYLIAMDMVDVLVGFGAVPVGPVGRLDDALAMVAAEGRQLHAAVLDLDLGGLASYPVADALSALAVPFVFVTGFRGEAIAAGYRDHPRVEKPIDVQVLAAALIVAV